jgi:hypothetical protein
MSDVRNPMSDVLSKAGVLSKSDVLPKAADQIRSVSGKAWKTDSSHNIFLDEGDEDLPLEHIRNRRFATTVG